MSAPPIGIIIITPKISGIPTITGNKYMCSGCATSITATPTATPQHHQVDEVLSFDT